MEKVLVVCSNKETENNFIKNYLHGINYFLDNGKYNTGDELITVTDGKTSLIGLRFHRVYVDTTLDFDNINAQNVLSALLNGKSRIKYF